MSNAQSSVLGRTPVVQRPEWERVPGIVRRFGIGKSSIYNLMNDGKIKTSSLQIRGKNSKLRLVSVASVEAYLEAQVQHKEVGELQEVNVGTEAVAQG